SWIVNCTYSASWIKVSPRNDSYSERSKKASKNSPFNWLLLSTKSSSARPKSTTVQKGRKRLSKSTLIP
ncbi:hypothetical protein CSPAE12_00534, partial [Colletotrichum incanum]